MQSVKGVVQYLTYSEMFADWIFVESFKFRFRKII